MTSPWPRLYLDQTLLPVPNLSSQPLENKLAPQISRFFFFKLNYLILHYNSDDSKVNVNTELLVLTNETL